MPRQIVKKFEGFSTPEDAELAGIGLRLEGYETSVEAGSGGKFALVATKLVLEATNSVEGILELSDGTDDEPRPDTAEVSALLDLIAGAESNGNYNAYYNNVGNTNAPKFTSMTLESVREWQDEYVNDNGSISSAVGRYQIIRSTFDMVVSLLSLDVSSVRFTQETQDLMATRLLERRGLAKFLRQEASVVAFGNSLAKEWAGLPVLERTSRDGIVIERGDSYYSGVAGNRAFVDPNEMEALLNEMIA